MNLLNSEGKLPRHFKFFILFEAFMVMGIVVGVIAAFLQSVIALILVGICALIGLVFGFLCGREHINPKQPKWVQEVHEQWIKDYPEEAKK